MGYIGVIAQAAPPDDGIATSAVIAIVSVLVFVAVVLGALLYRARRTRTTTPGSDPSSRTMSVPPLATQSSPPASSLDRAGTAMRPASSVQARPPDERTPVGVFISYRRDDAPHLAGRLSDRMREQFGPARIFMDVDSIEPGLDFGEVISEAVENCRVMLVIIGPKWMLSTETGGRRLDSPDDYVRIEIEQALKRGVRVIPVLVDGAVMPQSPDLPEPIKGLARRNAVEVTHRAFSTDADRLVELTERLLSTTDSSQ